MKLQKVFALAAIGLTLGTTVNSLSPAPANAETTPQRQQESPGGILGAIKAQDDGNHARAIELFSQAISTLKPGDSLRQDALMGRARSFVIQNQRDQGIADFTEVIKHDPKNVTAYRLRGMAYGHSTVGKYDLALADANKTLEFDPKNPDYLIDRAFAYYDTDNKGKAKDDLKAARDIYKEKGDDAGVKYVKKVMKSMGV
jgi:tetratricopeptide (TPR) repeat protein